ncbi:MAG TPA: insulinase family protein, partial [Gemmatimonadales bacterium]|nr:insulinase family protein [Gemmatimonadales bacterium]
WKAGDVPHKNIAAVQPPSHREVYLLDRPGSEQSLIFVGQLAPPKKNPHEIAISALNDVMGGSFLSRINMNLREDKHWSYGAFTFVRDARGQRPFLVYAPVQTDKTKESVAEVVKELNGVIGDHPVTADELARAKADLTLTLPGRWETMGAVGGSLAEIVQFGLPADFYDTYAAQVNKLDLSAVNDEAKALIRPDHAVWVVVGDRAKIEAGVREVLGDVQLLNPDGTPVQAPAATP